MPRSSQTGAEPPLAQGVDLSACQNCGGKIWLEGNKRCEHKGLMSALAAAAVAAESSEKAHGGPASSATAAASSPYGKLDPSHFAFLSSLGITAETIAARKAYSVTDSATLKDLGFSRSQYSGADRVPGLLLPVHTTDGGNGLCVYRPDVPRPKPRRGNGASSGLTSSAHRSELFAAYEVPAGMALRLDCPPSARRRLAQEKTRLWIVDNQLKADALVSAGLTAIAMLGAWGYKAKWGEPWLADWEYIALGGRTVRVVLDSAAIHKSFPRLSEHLSRAGAIIERVELPEDLADWLVEKGSEALALLDSRIEITTAAEPSKPIEPAAPSITFMDEPPATMDRPLIWFQGHAYAAIWRHVQKEVTEERNENGEVVKLARPRREQVRKQFVICDDGKIYGAQEDGFERADLWLPIEDLEIKVEEMDIPAHADRFWSSRGISAFREGKRPDPASLHIRMTDIIDHFMDFDLSFGDQRDMAELCALWALSTWFVPAFSVFGYLWASGSKGTAKTKLITAVARMSFLGHILLSDFSSVAGLRDLASVGATIAFDDAENIADSENNSSRDDGKRQMLLGGNRAESSWVTLKTPTPNGGWKLQMISNFAPRLFGAIQEPDETLGSRAIRIPLVPSFNKAKANADVGNPAMWPHPLREIVDDCWSLALSRLSEIRACDAVVTEKSPALGRMLDTWRGVLTLAWWLDRSGSKGLWRRMCNLSLAYQSERQQEPLTDLTPIVIRAVVSCFNTLTLLSAADTSDTSDADRGRYTLSLRTNVIADEVRRIVHNEDLPFEASRLSPDRIGRILSRLRYTRERIGKDGSRCWVITRERVLSDLKRYRLEAP